MLKLIKDFLVENRFISFTLNDLQLYWRRKTAEHSVVSVSTLGRWLRNKFDMSYKKLNKIHPSVPELQSCRKMIEATSIQIELAKRDTVAVYIDEFKYSSHTNKHYGWAERGRPRYRKLFPGSFQASFMIAFSSKEIHGVMATTKTFNSEKFVYFLKMLTKSINDSYAFIWDNCKIHVSKEVQDYLGNNKLWLITIPAYCPFVNAWEKLILIIKSRVRMEERKGKVVNLQMFKKFIDSIKSWELQKWISESFKESSELIHKIIIPD